VIILPNKIVGIPCFTPPQKAVELEGSRVFAKSFMRKYGIPTAYYSSFDNLEAATSYVHLMFKDNDHRIAITPDGPTANERVLLPGTKKQALEDLGRIMSDAEFSTAGNSVIIEEYLLGYEISILTFSDGKTFFSLPAGQSHKRLLENNIGPNTGGMGIYSPVPMVTPEVLRRINDNILKPTFDAIKKEGEQFCFTLIGRLHSIRTAIPGPTLHYSYGRF
jgi:phosphoribosylamine--glycine ligase/phosphoribosylformylglycinamidine cyclo-ligase